MSRLDQLINELCPDGVRFKTLSSELDYIQPTKYLVSSTKYSDEYPIPVLTAGQSFVLGYTNESHGIYEASKDNPVVIFDDFTTSFHWVDFPFKVKSSALKIIKPNNDDVNFRYIYHCMKGIEYVPSTHARQWISVYSQFEIPVPPLAVQEEIVRILDTFTELTTELTTELALRKRQYEFFKDRLLSYEVKSDSIFKTIGELSTYRRGSFPQPYGNSEWYDGEGSMPFVQVADINNNMQLVDKPKRAISVKAQKYSVYAPKGSIIISLQGTIGRIAVTQYDSYIDRTIAIFQDVHEMIDKKYFVYQVQRIFSIKEKNARGSTIKTITKEELTSFPIAVPLLKEQKAIADILDTFDLIVNDITTGLPAEIELRQKQYEYYRDKLLTFKRKD